MSALKFEICMGKMKVQVHFVSIAQPKMISFQKSCEMYTSKPVLKAVSQSIKMPFPLNLPPGTSNLRKLIKKAYQFN